MSTEDPIAHACRLLREAAAELQQNSTYSLRPDDWSGETEAKAAFDEYMALADALEAAAVQEPVATVFTMEALAPGGHVKYHATVHKPLPAGTKLYAHPKPAAQDAERIQALELEVRQLTEQIAELRGGGAAKEYAELPESCYEDDSGLKTYDSGDMRTFADATHALRIQHPAPSAAPEEPLQAFDSPRAKSLMRAWEEGWEACRDAEYVGEEAQNDAFNSSHTLTLCLAEDQLLPTPQADSVPTGYAHGWVTIWPTPDGLRKPGYSPGKHKPSYGPELDAKLCVYPVFLSADSVLEDAARWQMAVLVGKEVMLHPANRTHQNAVKAYMDAVHSGLDLTGAVDAARKQGRAA